MLKTQNKKIIHVITRSIPGGAQSVVVTLANEQVKQNDVYVLSSEGDAWKSLDPRVHVIKIKELKREISLKDIIVLARLYSWRRKIKPDVVHLHSSKMGLFGRLVFKKSTILYTVHGFDSMRKANRKLLVFERLLQKRCRFIVGVCKYDEIALKEEGITNNVTYIYNGVKDTVKDPLTNENEKLVKKLNSLKTEFQNVIISLARDDAQKKIDLFFEVAKLMPDTAFVWAGNRNDYVTYKNVFLLGSVPMGYQLLHASDLFILCTNYEGLPMSIIEAFAYSKPVVSSSVGGVPELMDGTNGFAVNNNPEDFVEAINKILDQEEEYKAFAINARKTYEENFYLDSMVNSYDDLYYSICNEKV